MEVPVSAHVDDASGTAEGIGCGPPACVLAAPSLQYVLVITSAVFFSFVAFHKKQNNAEEVLVSSLRCN